MKFSVCRDSPYEPTSQTISDNSRASLDHKMAAMTTAHVAPSTNDTEKSTCALSRGNSNNLALDERLKSYNESESIVNIANLNKFTITNPSVSSNNHEVIVSNDCENTKKRKADSCSSLDDSLDEDGINKTNERGVKNMKTCLLTNRTSKKSCVSTFDCDYESANILEIDEPEEINSCDEDDMQYKKLFEKLPNKFQAYIDSVRKLNNSKVDLSRGSGFSSVTFSAKQNTFKNKINLHFESSNPELQMECTSETVSECQKNTFNLQSKDFNKILDILQSCPPKVCKNIVVFNYMNIFFIIWIHYKMLNIINYCIFG